MFTSRASCTEPWRQISVCSAIHSAFAFFSLPVIRKKKRQKKTTRPCLCCMQLVMHDCDKPIKGPALCWAANYFTRLSASRPLFPPLPSSVFFSLPFSREIHLLRRAEPRCAEEAVGARKKDVPHYQQPL